jgi:multidrug efflux pump subunit AcrB
VNGIIAWFVHNPVAANLLMMVLIVGGLATLPSIHQEEFPSIDVGMIRISVAYLGASPEESEEAVCIRIEEEVEGTEGVDRISSLAVEGACVVTLELPLQSDGDSVTATVKNRIDSITTFPAETERPIISQVVTSNRVLQLAVMADADERTLKVLAQEIRDDIVALAGVSQASLLFAKPYEISLEISEASLRRHGLSLVQVARAVRRASLDMPGGSVKTASGEILLRTKGQAYVGGDFEDIVILTRPDGTSIRLGDIALVRDGFEDADLVARFNGRTAVLIEVRRIGEEDTLAISERVNEYVAQKQVRMPAGTEVVVLDDDSLDLIARLEALMRSAGGGLVLVLLLLGLFLRFRLAMWVAAGVPIAFLGALALFPTLGLAISTLSVMAFILVIGIVVDDAIVIGESVYSHERRGEDRVQAAIAGTREVCVPVIFGVMTTIAAFLPLTLVTSRMGQFFAVIGTTAIVCLIFSLIESQLVLPAHLAYRRTSREKQTSIWIVRHWTAWQQRVEEWMEHVARDLYAASLLRAIEWRYLTLAIAVGVIIVTSALFTSGRLRYQFMPEVEGESIFATLTMPAGVPVSLTEAGVAQLAAAADRLQREVEAGTGPGSVIRSHLSTIGGSQNRDGPGSSRLASSGGSHLAEVSLHLTPRSERDLATREIEVRWRELTGAVPGAIDLVFSSSAFSMGEAVNIELRGGSVRALTGAAADLKTLLAGYDGVSEIADSFRDGKQELKLSILPEAKPLGLSLDDLARQVRQAFYGLEVQRVQRGRDDVRVMLRYPASERRSLANLEDMRIRTADGTEVPFASVAVAEVGRGYSTIRRRDHERVINVTADVARGTITPEALLADVEKRMPALLLEHPGINFSLEGEQQAQAEAAEGLFRGLVFALLLIYALLAIPLRSYSQPLIIMSVIPFGTVGAVLGHLLMGWDVVFFSVLGMVALAGVVVNASLVLVHFINRRREAGMPFLEAVSTAGVARFRPIALTSVTTYAGLVPLMFEANPQATMMIPMAISLGYGVLVASVFTLFLVPSLYVVLEDARVFLPRFWRSLFEAEVPDSAA